MSIKKMLFLFIITICMGTVFFVNVLAEELGACIFINGEYYTDTKIENSNPACILVALSFFEKFGYAVSWDNSNQIAVIEDTVLSGDEKYSSNHKWWAIMTGKDKLVINEPGKQGRTSINFKDMGISGLPLQGMDDVYVPIGIASKITGEMLNYSQGTIYINLKDTGLLQKIYRFNVSNAQSTAHFSADSELIELFGE
ncbi:MAG: hypothetical protein ABRQ39_07615 [Candidatus Eremiobacterota bacterium]